MSSTTTVPNILIVDDEPLVCWSLSSALVKSGYRTKTASDGKQAIEELRTQKYDLLITDFRLPQYDGFKVATEAKRLSKKIPVIMISAFCDEVAHEKTDASEIDTFMGKPFDLSEMVNIVKYWLVKQRESDVQGSDP